MKGVTILVVDDEPSLRDVVCEFLRSLDYDVMDAADGQAALDILAQDRVDIVISDIMMPRLDGFALLKELRSRHPGVHVLMMTGFGSIESAVQAMTSGAVDYVTKPINFRMLQEKLVRVVKQQRLIRDLAEFTRRTEESEIVTELERENASHLVGHLAQVGEKLAAREAQIAKLAELIDELKGSIDSPDEATDILVRMESTVNQK